MSGLGQSSQRNLLDLCITFEHAWSTVGDELSMLRWFTTVLTPIIIVTHWPCAYYIMNVGVSDRPTGRDGRQTERERERERERENGIDER